MELKYRVAASFRNSGTITRSNFHSKDGAEIIAYCMLPEQDLYDSIWIEVLR